MPALTTTTTTGAVGEEVHPLLDDVAAADGRFPLSDHMRLELANGSTFASVTAHDGDRLVGYAQLATLPATRSVENLVVDVCPPRRPSGPHEPALGRGSTRVSAAWGGGPVQWWARCVS